MIDNYPFSSIRRLQLIMLPLLFATLLLMNGCGGESPAPNPNPGPGPGPGPGPTPDPIEEQMKLLTTTWKLGTVKNDGLDVTAKYTGFTLTIASDKKFTTTNGHNAWPATGSFSFVNNDPKRLLRNDGIEMSINSINTTSIELAFTKNTAGGRGQGVTGQFIFSLVK